MNSSDPHYLGHRQRLRERFLKSGLEGFADYEVVELLLTLAIPRSDVKDSAKHLIARFGNLRGILDAPTEELQAVNGIGSVAPTALKIIRAAATLYLQQSAEGANLAADHESLAAFWRMRIGANPNEAFEVAYLDSGRRLLRDGVERLEEGTIDRAADVIRFASLGTTEQGESGTQFRVDYLKPSGAIGFYHPDWVVVQGTGKDEVNWIIETKGRIWEGTTAKDEAIRDWCERISDSTGCVWRYLRVNQTEFDAVRPSKMADLIP
jgi:DNA repair protein RadC